jgi:hypothetical protein
MHTAVFGARPAIPFNALGMSLGDLHEVAAEQPISASRAIRIRLQANKLSASQRARSLDTIAHAKSDTSTDGMLLA